VTAEPGESGVTVFSEDVFETGAGPGPGHDIVTAVGIFEYLQGHTCDTTERRQGLPEPKEAADAERLAARIAAITAPDASLIVNTYRPHSSIRLLEIFGKKFDYRTRENMAGLLATASFESARRIGSGTIYDVDVYKKRIA